jgi:DNA-3-methyladenine glycosylase
MTSRRSGRVLPRSFYDRPTLDVARGLLGKVVVRRAPEGLASGMIVEAEAYVGESDPACHAASGLTRRNEPMYGSPGHAYVYFSYGVHHLLNVVTEVRGFPAAVLIRALEPVDGVDLMRRRRAVGRSRTRGGHRGGSVAPDAALCRGPGNLTRALGITLTENRADLTRSARGAGTGLWIEDRGLEIDEVGWTPRIGIRLGADLAWRCFVARSASVSGRRRPVPGSR